MIRVSIFYPQGSKFDADYYATKHMPMIAEKVPAVLRWEMDKGIAGMAPGTPAPYVAIGHLYFNSVEEFTSGFAPAAADIMADVPNYTDARPEIQISEVTAS